MNCILFAELIKFSVKKNKPLIKYWKTPKNFVCSENWEPWVTVLKDDALCDFMTFTTNYTFQGEAVQLVADGEAPKLKQTEEGATYEPIAKRDIAKVRCKAQVLTILGLMSSYSNFFVVQRKRRKVNQQCLKFCDILLHFRLANWLYHSFHSVLFFRTRSTGINPGKIFIILSVEWTRYQVLGLK